MPSPTFSPRLFRAHCVSPVDYFDRSPARFNPPPAPPAPVTFSEGARVAVGVAGIVLVSVAAAFAESLVP